MYLRETAPAGPKAEAEAKLGIKTRNNYRSQADKHIVPCIGHQKVRAVDADIADSFYSELRRCATTAMVSRESTTERLSRTSATSAASRMSASRSKSRASSTFTRSGAAHSGERFA
ncbi:hypothetical protein AB0E63_44995 [Kribbella sp. NPDC026596]|uniref:hypothetical protein n=1 Tax=Kribbella sp. NPDC026596 TaxID=3155122 RepID=UPI00340D3998